MILYETSTQISSLTSDQAEPFVQSIIFLSHWHWLWNKETDTKPGCEPPAGDASFSRESLIKSELPVQDHTEFISRTESLLFISSFNYSSMAEFLCWIHPATFFPRPRPDLAGYSRSTKVTNKIHRGSTCLPAPKDKEAPGSNFCKQISQRFTKQNNTKYQTQTYCF